MLQFDTQTEPEHSQRRVGSPTREKSSSPEHRSQNAPNSQFPPTKDEATESEAESLQYDKGTKLNKKGMYCYNEECSWNHSVSSIIWIPLLWGYLILKVNAYLKKKKRQ